jgi:enoyl-CoA hydratase/carnithine racemase
VETGTTELLCEFRDRVAIITLNRPEARNALSDQLTPALRSAIRACGDDPGVGAVLITGSGRAFCAGGDVKGMRASASHATRSAEDRIVDLQDKQRRLTGALVALEKPTIAALPGAAVGAGMSIALACDLRIAGESAFMSTAYAPTGLSGDYGITWLLTRLVGSGRATELLFGSERINAARCEAMGLINRITPDDQLQAEAFRWARQLAHGPMLAFALMKANLSDALTSSFPECLDREATRVIQTSLTRDHQEAVTAFIEKRQPRFLGR